MSGPIDPRLLRHARSSRAGVAALAALGAGQAGATLAVAVALTLIVTGSWGAALALLGGAFLARAGLAWATEVVAQRTAARVTDELRRSVLRAVLRRGPAWVADFGAGRLTAVLTGGLGSLRPWFSGYLPSLILGVALPPIVVLAMALVDPTSAVITLLTLPLIPLLGALIGWATQARARQRWQADARLAGHFLDVVRGLPTLRVFGRAGRQVEVIADLTDRHRSATLRVLRVAFLSSTALDLVGTLSVGLIAVEAGLRVAAGEMALAPALLVILLAPEAYRPLREMAARYHASTEAGAVIADVDEILGAGQRAGESAPGAEGRTLRAADAVPGADGRAQRVGGADRGLSGGVAGGLPGVVATGLRARYPGGGADALALDELVVRAGEIVALRGASGAGKTTALRVLAGLHPAAAGEFAAARVVYLPQRPSLPHARTVADLFPDGTGPDEIAAALAEVGLAGELDAETVLGERGAGVSAGQRQRLALAALPTEPATLLLDEPTAHLDPATELLVISRLRRAADAGSAVLVVAHRPALLAAADRTVEIRAPRAETVFERAGVVAVEPGSPARRAGRSRWGFGAAAALGAGSSLAGIVLTGAAAWLLVRASTLPPVLTLSTAVVLVRGSAVARPLLRYAERLVAHDVAFARLGRWRAQVYAALIRRVPGPQARRRGDLLGRIVDDVDARVDGLLRWRLPAITAVVTAAVAGLAAVLSTPAAALPVSGGLLIAGVVAPLLAARLIRREEAATGVARARLRDAMVETVDGVEEVAVSLDVPEKRSSALAELEVKAAHAGGTAAAVAQIGWGFAVVGTAMALGGLSAEWAAVVLLGVVALGEPVLGLTEAAVARERACGAERRLAALTAEPPVTASIEAGRLAQPDGPAQAGRSAQAGGTARDGGVAGRGGAAAGMAVSVRGLVAGWGERAVLRGLDLDLAAGARVAITGRSGSGKSTLGAVLAGLLDPSAGHVGASAGRSVLVGDETEHVFASTVRENLRLAKPDAGDDELVAVLRRVRLGGWLAGLPNGLDSWLGAGGSTMSGGQVRRFAVARALLAEPGLLILDEPTEGLDAETGGALMADLLDAAAGRTVVLLAHRREGLELVDEVFSLETGRLRRAPSGISGRATCR